MGNLWKDISHLSDCSLSTAPKCRKDSDYMFGIIKVEQGYRNQKKNKKKSVIEKSQVRLFKSDLALNKIADSIQTE